MVRQLDYKAVLISAGVASVFLLIAMTAGVSSSLFGRVNPEIFYGAVIGLTLLAGYLTYEIATYEKGLVCEICKKEGDGSVHYCWLKSTDLKHCGDCHMRLSAEEKKQQEADSK